MGKRTVNPKGECVVAERAGFTLIELSIVLVIIGLLIGGVLVGADLTRAAEIRATLSQIDKYQTAANSFLAKYGALPGDMNASAASQFGFASRGPFAGQGDGNGILEGVSGNGDGLNSGGLIFAGETEMFWVDLSQAGLIDGNFSTVNILGPPPSLTSPTQIGTYCPAAKLGRGNFIYAWSGGATRVPDEYNYLGVSAITDNGRPGGAPSSARTITVQQAYAMDKKIDDGLPQSGRATAMYGRGGLWSGDLDSGTYGPVVPGDGVATPGTVATCYDNSSVAGAPEQYSLGVNNGAGANCAMSFQFQ